MPDFGSGPIGSGPIGSEFRMETETLAPSPPDSDPQPRIGTPPHRRSPLWHALLILGWGAWWGGLTFYALLVVPIGTDRVGSLDQGFITQRVTWWHNATLIAFVALLAVDGLTHRIDGLLHRARGFWWMWSLLALTAVGLCIYHAVLSSAMDWESGTVGDGFYPKHAGYLWLTALEWTLGLACLGWLVSEPVALLK